MAKIVSFTRFRASWYFVLSFCVFIVGWFVWNLLPFLPHFDEGPEWAHLNLLLSVEATLSMAIIMMEQSKQADEDRALLRAGLDNDQEIAQRVRAILALVEEVHEDVQELDPVEIAHE